MDSISPPSNFDRYRMRCDANGERMPTIAGLDHPTRMFDVADRQPTRVLSTIRTR